MPGRAPVARAMIKNSLSAVNIVALWRGKGLSLQKWRVGVCRIINYVLNLHRIKLNCRQRFM